MLTYPSTGKVHFLFSVYQEPVDIAGSRVSAIEPSGQLSSFLGGTMIVLGQE